MKNGPSQLDVRRYDAVVRVLTESPESSFREVAKRVGLTEMTVRKVWEGTINRPSVVVLERLAIPRRCGTCGALCSEWPCVPCEMERRTKGSARARVPTRFVYRNQKM